MSLAQTYPIKGIIVRWFARVQIVRWVEDYQPGIVECQLADRYGRKWLFTVKLPYVSVEELSRTSKYPHPGYLPCVAVRFDMDEAGRGIIEIDTSLPMDLETESGNTRFEVYADDVVETPRGYDDL